MNKLVKCLIHPRVALHFIKTRCVGYLYKIWYQTIKRKATIGNNLKVDGKLNIQGPGNVIIGDNVRVGMLSTLWTNTEQATISVGNNTFLNGTRFGCSKAITIGNNCILADCRLMDTDYHGVHPNNRDDVKIAPINIEDNVWITIQCIILKGVTIKTGTTITPGSVVVNNIPANVVAGGNPTKVIKSST